MWNDAKTGWKRGWGILLAVLLAGGAAGCGDVGDKEAGGEERMRITIGFWEAEEDLAGDAVLDEIESRFGVEFVPVEMSWNDHYQKVDRWAASNSLPDLFVGDYRNSLEYFDWIDRGLLHEIPEDMAEYPKLKAYLEGIDEGQAAFVGGKRYCIPRQTYPSQAWTCIDRVVAYRWDLAQEAGITKEPENWEEFQEMILAIIQADPEGKEIRGLTAENSSLIAGWLLPYSSTIAVSGGNDFFWKKDTDSLYRPVYMTDDLIPAFQLGRDMYESGVIEKEVILQMADSAKEKFLRGRMRPFCIPGDLAMSTGMWKDTGRNITAVSFWKT